MNPCRCGYLGDASRECSRAPRCGEDYRGKISGPLFDRIDLIVEITPVSPAELSRAPAGEPSAAVAERVAAAREMQRERYGEAAANNAEAPADRIALTAEARAFAEAAATRLQLSARGFTRTLRVSRTIADLAQARQVERRHVAEALSYRHRVPTHKLVRNAT
jgi:magnesium chelatase family protein